MRMTTEELIQRITAEVLKQLQPTAAAEPAPQRTGPRVLLLYTGGDQWLNEAVALASELAAAGAQIKSVCTPSGEALLGPERLERLAAAGELLTNPTEMAVYKAVHWAEVVAVPILTQNTAAKVALGIRDSLSSNLLAAAIMMGRKVLVCPDSAVPRSAPPRYRAMLTGHIDQLRTFGVATMPVADMARACLGSPAPQASPPAKAPSARRLVTAAEVEAAIRSGQQQLLIPRAAIVTPLAADLCREHGISLSRQDGGDCDAAG